MTRDKKQGKNVAAFTPEIFKTKKKQYIASMQNWRCIANKQVIEFIRDDLSTIKHYEFYKHEFNIS